MAQASAPALAVEATPGAEAIPSSQPQWRSELSHKVEAYRVRTGQIPAGEPQRPLPFPEARPAAAATAVAAPKPRPAPRRTERLRIYIDDQRNLGFPSVLNPSPNHALVPVAALARRAYAWLLDMGFVIACWGMFLGLLKALGVEISLTKLAVAICLAILFLLYAQYFALFTAFGGTTPGMWIAHLRVVSFDGNRPTPQQLLWRSLGYLMSAGAALLGFLWALWDEDRLCWQDRASQTYLTAAAPVAEGSPAGVHH